MTDTTESRAEQAANASAEGHVYRRRYERYTGTREGRVRSYAAVVFHSWRRALGIRRKWTAKIMPIFLYAAAFVPVIGFIAVPAIVGIDSFQFQPPELLGAISLILLIFAAASSPEMICDDRRENVLPLYYSRGLSRWDYLTAKLIALGSIMLSVSLLPALLLFLGNTFLQDEPFSYLSSNWDQAPRIFAAAILLSFFYATIGLALSSITDRKGIASAIIIGFFMAGTAIAEGLFMVVDESLRFIFAMVAPMEVPEGILYLVFGEAPTGSMADRGDIEPFWYLISVVGFAVLSGAVLYRRYLRED